MTSDCAGDQVSQESADSTLVKATGAIGGHDRLNEAPQWLRDLSDAQDWCHLLIGLVPNTVYPKGEPAYRCYDIIDISYNGGSDDDPYEGSVIARGCTPSRAVSRAIEKLRQSGI